MYCASKYALEGFTESLRGEVRPYGIHVVLIEPGDFHTDLTPNRRVAALADSNSPYSDNFNNALEVIESGEINGPTPDQIAILLEQIINTSKPRLRYLTGPFTQRLAVSLKKVLPYSLFEWLMMKNYNL